MANLMNSFTINLKKGLKAIEPVAMLFSGTYLLINGIQNKSFPLGIAGSLLVFRGGLDLGKVIEESEMNKELLEMMEK